VILALPIVRRYERRSLSTWLTRFFAATMARRSKEAIRRASASTKPPNSTSSSAYRLSVFPIQMPSLRERPEDILLLATYFIERYTRKAGKKIRNIERKTLEWLQAYNWPGNIRELQNVVERAVILCDGGTFSIDEAWLQPETRGTKAPIALAATLANREREMITAVLEESRGRISGPSGAAGKLGMPRTTLESKIKSLRINKHQFKCA
jgi:formate hydrogenlyase transcriptional activator